MAYKEGKVIGKTSVTRWGRVRRAPGGRTNVEMVRMLGFMSRPWSRTGVHFPALLRPASQCVVQKSPAFCERILLLGVVFFSLCMICRMSLTSTYAWRRHTQSAGQNMIYVSYTTTVHRYFSISPPTRIGRYDLPARGPQGRCAMTKHKIRAYFEVSSTHQTTEGTSGSDRRGYYE